MYDYAMELSQMLHTYQVADEGAAAQDQEATPTADSNEY
jgi:hypothetical protein